MAMFIPEDEREGKSEALKKLMDMMKSGIGEKLGGLKKPMSASLMIEKDPEDSDDEMSMDDDDDDRDERSPDEIERIKDELYRKYCNGGRV